MVIMKAAVQSSNQGKKILTRVIPPAAGWRHKGLGLIKSRLFVPYLGLGATFAALVASFFRPVVWLQLLLVGVAVILLVVLAQRIRTDLFTPLSHMRNWALRMRAGHLNARLPIPGHGEFTELARDINSLSEDLQTLSQEMEVQIRKQTESIEQKSRSLKILYEVAANINGALTVEDLLARFLDILMSLLGARAGSIRLLTDNNQLRMVASAGFREEILQEESLVPVDRCFCGSSLNQGTAVCHTRNADCEKFVGQPLFHDGHTEMISVPLDYQGRPLGVFNLFVDTSNPDSLMQGDMQELLTSIGRHLGMAIEKARLDDEARRLSIVEERNLLAHELHDSLAQTLASLRFQIRTIEESLATWSTISNSEVIQLKNSIEEANQELRELLTHFRTPMDERGLVPALKDMIKKYRAHNNILVFLQDEWKEAKLPANLELQILRIVQESLSNIRKHSSARAVRILLRQEADNNYLVLVEDDGVGLSEDISNRAGVGGNHIGISIMQERAQKLHGELSLESEPGEGTRVTLIFRYPFSADKQTTSTLPTTL